MDTKLDNVIFKFLKIPVPLGVGGALIWGVVFLLREWNPTKYPNLQSVFLTVPWIPVYTALIILAVIAYYIYVGISWFRLIIIRTQVWLVELRYQPPDGMTLVPAGWFRFRLTGRREHIHGFYIDKYLVTNEQYFDFINETKSSPPQHWVSGKYPPGKDRHPVTYVSWEDAKKYCQWRSKKLKLKIMLPSEEEWEKAARGPFGFQYPWGYRFDSTRCNVGKRTKGDTNVVDAYPTGRSPYGCYDMCGNVWEWTRSSYDEERGIVVLKGGSYYFDVEFAPVYMRYHDPKDAKWHDVGFRCVASLF